MKDVLRNASLLRLLGAYLAFKASEWGAWIAVLIYAYSADGPTAVGVIATVQLVPAALIAPFAPRLVDWAAARVGWLSPLAIAYAAPALAVAATAVAIQFAPSLAVYAVAVVLTATMAFARPAHAATLVEVAASPVELSAGNALGGAVDGAGIVLGPAAAGILYATIGPAPLFGLIALVLAGAVLACRDLGWVTQSAGDGAGLRRTLVATVRLLTRARGALVAALAVGAASLAAGLVDVLIVVAVLGPLGAGEEAVGLLNAALGLGTMAAGALAARAAAGSGPAAVAVGLLLAGAAVAASGAANSSLFLAALLGAVGFGLGLGDIASRNVLLRLVPVSAVAGVFALVEAVYTGGLAAGAALAPVLLAALNVHQAFLATGVGLALIGVLMIPALLVAARAMVVPGARYEVLRALDPFRPLPVPAVELLARSAQERDVTAGTVVIREGEAGDSFFAITGGRFRVSIGGRPVAELAAGDHFGEIALLRGSRRTVTVTADTDAHLLSVGRAEFLAAVTNHAVATERLAATVAARLEREPGLLAPTDGGG
jgi:hypothetical protein